MYSWLFPEQWPGDSDKPAQIVSALKYFSETVSAHLKTMSSL